MPPKTPVIISRSTSNTASSKQNMAISAKTRYAHLSPQEQEENIAREEAAFKQVQAFTHERLAPTISDLTEITWAAFYTADKHYIEVQNGMQSTISRILPGAWACLTMKMIARLKRQVNVRAEFTELELLELLNTIYRDNLNFDKLKDEVTKIRMTCKEFSMPAFDSLSGKFYILTEVTFLSVWQSTPMKTQVKLFISALSPAHLCKTIADKLEQKTYDNFYEAFAIISAAASAEVERLLNNSLAKASIADQSSLPTPKESPSTFKECNNDTNPMSTIHANLLKTGEEPCTNCLLYGFPKGFIKHTTEACRSACACGKEPPHLKSAKGKIICEPPQIVNHVSYLHEEEQTESDHDDNDVIPFPHVRASRVKVQFNDDVEYSDNKSVLVIKTLTARAGSIVGDSASDSDD